VISPATELLVLGIVDIVFISAFCIVRRIHMGRESCRQTRACEITSSLWLSLHDRSNVFSHPALLSFVSPAQSLISDRETVEKMAEYNSRGMGASHRQMGSCCSRGSSCARRPAVPSCPHRPAFAHQPAPYSFLTPCAASFFFLFRSCFLDVSRLAARRRLQRVQLDRGAAARRPPRPLNPCAWRGLAAPPLQQEKLSRGAADGARVSEQKLAIAR